MKKKGLFIAFALLLIGIPIFLMIKSEDVLENGIRHKLRLRAYDPFDPFRGKYLRLNYDNTASCDPGLETGDACYITLKKGEDGFSTFEHMHQEKPETEDYFESRVLYAFDSTGTFKLDNMEKYFINESKAGHAERVVQDFQRKKPDDIYVAIRVMEGEVRLEDVYIQEVPLLEYLESHPEN
mgnify:CR=1 FL=1